MKSQTELNDWIRRCNEAKSEYGRLLEEVASAKKRVERCEEFVRIERQRLIPRKRTESPIQYYRRTHQVIDSCFHRFNGHYYCNPAHCSAKFRSKKNRDAHLTAAYGVLD